MTRILASRALLSAVALASILVAALFALSSPGQASAHPLGNFTVNRYTRIELFSDVIRLNYVLDLAEIPAFQEIDAIDVNGDGISGDEAQAYAQSKAQEIAAQLDLRLDGSSAPLALAAAHISFPEGQGGLDTVRLEAVFEAPAPDGGASLAYQDENYSDRIGWKEIVVSPGTGAVVTGDAPTADVSRALTSYPDDQLSSPLDVSETSFTLDATDAQVAPPLDVSPVVSEAPSRAGGGFASLIAKDNLTLTVVLFALLAAFAFGAVHALEPGHGKTLVAAYFVGVKGTTRQALTLGLIIAVTHTVGVLTIGLVAIFGSQWVLPERLYPWLSLVAGIMVLALGLRLIAARGGGRLLHGLLHRLSFGRHHHHEHVPAPAAGGVPPWRGLIALGLADGLTPSPSALVVLLAAVSLDRIGLGIALIAAFSLGLATVLAAVSLALLYARQVMNVVRQRLATARLPLAPAVAASFTPESSLIRLVPLGGALALVAVGLALTIRALGEPGLTI